VGSGSEGRRSLVNSLGVLSVAGFRNDRVQISTL
jgi:hypothetical protein